MVGHKILIILSLAFLASCAQVGTITGGQRDLFAPKPDMEGANPPNGSLLFKGNTIIIPFDEYFTIADPTNNIRIVPPDVSVKASFKRKDLILQWEGDLKTNTTYSIYLDKAIKDLSEGNDSLMRYIFSTGTVIDSLRYGGLVQDAWTNEPVKNVTALLLNKDSSIVSYSRSNQNGEFELANLPHGEFQLILVNDQNADLKVSAGEQLAFRNDGMIALLETVQDSVPFRLSLPEQERKLTRANFTTPGRLSVGANYSLAQSSFSVDGIKIDNDRVKWINTDSVELFLDETIFRSGSHVIKDNGNPNDSLLFRIGGQQVIKPTLALDHKGNSLPQGERVQLNFPAWINSVDSAHIHLLNSEDSTELQPLGFGNAFDELYIELPVDASRVLLMIDSASVQGQGISNAYFEGTITIKKERELGIISIKVGTFGCPLIIDLMQGKETIRRIFLEEADTFFSFDHLNPGVYSFRVIEDRNGNQRWDQANYLTRQQPEMVRYFKTENALRANWELEIELIPEGE